MVNVVICGTPGTGKSSLVERIRPKFSHFNFINISQFAIQNECTEDYDETLDTHVIDEDKLATKLIPILEKSSSINILESIHADVLPTNLINWIFVLRTDNTILFDRLKARNYNDQKISNNLEAEIFQVIQDEATEIYGQSCMTVLNNNCMNDLDTNSELVISKLETLLKN